MKLVFVVSLIMFTSLLFGGTDVMVMSPNSPMTGNFVVRCKSFSKNPKVISPEIEIRNTGYENIQLSKIRVKYFYTDDGVNSPEVLKLVSVSGVSKKEVVLDSGLLVITKNGANSYIEVMFNTDKYLASFKSIKIKLSLSRRMKFNQKDDFSYGKDNVAGYFMGVLKSGVEPTK